MERTVAGRLQQMQAEFRRRIEAIRKDLQAASAGSFAEQAQARENDQVLERLLHEAEIELGRVNQALARLKEGHYGVCVRCGGEISASRLAAVPQTDICRECARQEAEISRRP